LLRTARTVAGLAPVDAATGYQTVVVAPRPATALTSAAPSIETGHGHLPIDWNLDADGAFVAQLACRADRPQGSTCE